MAALPIRMWFAQSGNNDRRKPANRLKRATREAEILEEAQIDLWLELGAAALGTETLLQHQPLRRIASGGKR